MKKKSTDDEVFTKGYLDSKLSREFAEFKTEFKAEIREMNDNLSEKLVSTWTETMDTFYQRVDPLLSELENSRIHRELSTEDAEKAKAQLKDHELRISKLEHS